jgi:nicotinate-nucleotide pyrophosphorylase (carboxylating)
MDVDKKLLDSFIDRALIEDVGEGDHTSLACIPQDERNEAELLIKDVGVIAGVDFAKYVFQKLDPQAGFQEIIKDGKDVAEGDVAFKLEANTRALLKGERTVLNVMQRMSGIATLSSRFAVEVEDLPVKILDTRKTTPLLRFLEKWAVKIGGCHNYRSGLYDWIIIKDNHVEACGGIREAIDRVHEYFKRNELSLGITVEVRNLVELHAALERGAIDRIMLDNFELPLLREAIATIEGKYETEASGGITLHNVRKVAETGVDYISVGAITHSAGSLDMSLNII